MTEHPHPAEVPKLMRAPASEVEILVKARGVRVYAAGPVAHLGALVDVVLEETRASAADSGADSDQVVEVRRRRSGPPPSV